MKSVPSVLLATLLAALPAAAAASPGPAPVDAGWTASARTAGLGGGPLRPVLLAAAPQEDGEGDAGADIDFDLFGDTEEKQEELANPALDRKLETRRSMLRTHQILGLATLGAMAATAVLGQLNYDDQYGDGGDRSSKYLAAHRWVSYGTAGLYATTAGFSLFAPDPFDRPASGLDTATLHRIGVIGASAGMLTQIGLGFVGARSADAGNPDRPRQFASAHQVVGWTTLAFMTAAATVWIF